MKTKIEQRIENAVNAFFDNENLNENTELMFSANTAESEFAKSESFADSHKTLINILRQVFFFFPGTFVLFNLSLRFTVFTLNPTESIKSINPLFLIFCALMTVWGIGSLKNIRHLAIPVSIISFSVMLGILAELFGDGLEFYYNYAVYFFPLALIIPFLAKGLIDKTEKD